MPTNVPMISVIITAYKEPKTIPSAIAAFVQQLPMDSQLLVVCPDAETTAVVQQLSNQNPIIKHIPEPERKGKPHALNLGLAAARGDIVILSDGDVRIGETALTSLLVPFSNTAVGAVTGQPLSSSPRNTKLGYWSHLLLSAAHHTRLARDATSQFLLCSGYLFAFRRSLIESIPEDALAEDAVISHLVAQKGYRIRYAPEATVMVKYPDTYQDWLKQKVRSAGGYAQEIVRNSPHRMRSAKLEAQHGALFALTFANNAREFWWTLQLFAARLHLWSLVFWQVRVKQRPLTDLWQRVESTK